MGQENSAPNAARRQLLTLVTLAFAGCRPCPPRLSVDEGAIKLGDAHAHFFNASDLPISGFLKHVLLREFAPDAKDTWAAFVDIAANILKKMSITVEAERRRSNSLRLSKYDITDDEFVSELALRIDDKARKSDRSPLNLSYAALANLLDQYLYTAKGGTGIRTKSVPRARPVNRALLKSIVRGDELRTRRFDRYTSQAPAPGTFPNEKGSFKALDKSAAQVFETLSWAFLMLQGRCYHVERYLRSMRTSDAQPRTLLNLLVDYNLWLDDEPASESSHNAQILFWADYAKRYEDQVSIKTMAGYDPLKHAHQVVSRKTGYFDGLKSQVTKERVCGFKLYPPMGFQPSENRNLTFIGTDGIGSLVHDWWTKVHPSASLGAELDKALEAFFDYCIAQDIPILAHGRDSNLTATNFGGRADPKHWKTLILGRSRYAKLRLCIGHFTDVEPFISEVNKCKAMGDPWCSTLPALSATAALIDASTKGNADVYTEIGYSEEFLGEGGHALAKDFFAALKWYCQQFDTKCTRLMYGSDWIMLAREPHHNEYLDRIINAMNQSGWTKEMRENFLFRNLDRFLS